MSGGTVAYHLRPNKIIERQLFLDFLVRYHGFRPLHEFTYVGFGGPFLEDFRVIDGLFGLSKMISLEGNESVLRRQQFNRPFLSVECRRQMSGEFVAGYASEIDGNAVVWLDFANANERRVQLGEFQSLLGKMRAFAVLKVTLNANPATLSVREGLSGPDLQEARLVAAERQLGEFWGGGVEPKDMTRKAFPRVLLDCAIRASRQSLPPNGELTFVPVTAFAYADSAHTMLTLTGVVSLKRLVRPLLKALRLKNWDVAYRERRGPLTIATPMLSTRERMFLESMLPRHRATLPARAKFMVADTQRDSDDLISAFAMFYRHYPHFSRVIL